MIPDVEMETKTSESWNLFYEELEILRHVAFGFSEVAGLIAYL